MQRSLLPLLLLLSVPGFAQTGAQSYTPRRDDASVPTYINAEVVRVDRAAGTLTIRSETGDTVLTADRRLPGVTGLKAGAKVLVAYEVLVDENGRVRRLVTYLEPASPTSGEPGPPPVVVASGPAPGSTVRLLSTDRANRRITVTDESGLPVVLPVSARTARSLSAFAAGDVVGLSFGGGGVVSASVLPTVNGIQVMPAGTALGNFVIPPLTGQFVSFDPGTNVVTLRSATGLRSFPVSAAAGSGFIGLVPGENLSLGFQVTQEANRARLRAGGGTSTTTISRTGLAVPAGATPGVLSVGSVQNLGAAGSIQNVAAAQGGVATGLGSPQVAPNTASPNAPGLTNVSGATANTGQQAGAGLPFIGTGVGVPSVGGGISPFANSVPSVPTPSPVLNAVLPPAIAKAPLSEDEVGAMRAYGERDLDNAAMVLAAVANDVDAAWARYKMACLGGFVPETAPNREWFLLLDGRVRTPTDDQCRAMFTQMQAAAAGFEEQLGITLDAARRADVLPGRIREVLERHRIDR
jgi:hypothetical protein